MATAQLPREGAQFNLTLVIGEDYSKTLSYTDASNVAIDLTGCSFAMQVRLAEDQAVAFTPTITLVSPATAGKILISVSRATTLTLTRGTYKYNIMWLDALSTKHEFLYGTMFVVGGVTLI